MVTTWYSSTEAFAHAIKSAASDLSHQNLIARPWNIYAPAKGTWYLLPTTQWPAYPYSKFAIRKEEPVESFFLSLYVEKGFPSVAAEVYPWLVNKKMIIDQDWYWNQFLVDMTSPEFVQAVELVYTAYGSPLILKVSGTYASGMELREVDEEHHELNLEIPIDHSAGDFWFEVDEHCGLTLHEHRNVREEMSGILGVSNLSEMSQMLGRKGGLDWVWIDLELGVQLKQIDEGDVEHWSAGEIWRNLLAPLLPWVK